jgi:hypothetical protein
VTDRNVNDRPRSVRATGAAAPERKLTRRRAIAATALMSAGGFEAASLWAATAPAATRPRNAARIRAQAEQLRRMLEDPASRARIKAKVKGSTAEETVYTFCRLHLYLWLNDGNLLPMLSMQNLTVSSWRPLANGNYAGQVREVGVYTKFDTDELIDVWTNPVTGDRREVWQFIGGPLSVEIGPDGLVTGPEATLKPKDMRIDVLGEMAVVPNHSAFSFPNPLKADAWPKEAGQPTFYWDSMYYHAARVADLLDERQASVPAGVQFQNLVSFHPWLGMGRMPGRTYGRGLGAKLTSLDDIPAGARRAIEQKTPEIFDTANWKAPRVDFVEFTQKRKPT